MSGSRSSSSTTCRHCGRSRSRRRHRSAASWTASDRRRSRRSWTALSDWSGERGKALRLDLLRRYVGFPIWDAITYPIAVEHEVGERDGEIGIYRVSPRETSLVSPPDPKVPKLAGMSVHHFGAFFDRSSREKDYLWGRIDGCCQLITLMLDVLRDRGSTDAIQPSAFMRRACVAVLTEEWPHVPGAHDLAEHLWRQVSDDPPPA